MGSSSRRSVPKGNQIPKLSPSSSSFPAAAATKGTAATTVVLSLVTVSVATTTPGSSGGCDERQRRRLGKPLMAMMASYLSPIMWKEATPIELARQEPPIVMVVRKFSYESSRRVLPYHHMQ
ncbi:hypothetical protein Lal_00038517 [Lupinus albus]|nr:hypothetical protein Lal_00038517 [Lupinus albus]